MCPSSFYCRQNQFYLDSMFHKELPFNNPYAQFGSAPGPSTYVRDETKASWTNLGSIVLRSTD
jgi:hypothetical protein